MRFFRTLRHVLRSEWAQALVSTQNSHVLDRLGWKAWAYYRLGMYASVADLPLPAGSLRYAMPMLVSMAACGRHDQARDWLQSVDLAKLPERFVVVLCDALAPFMPVDALRILRTTCKAVPPTLLAGLLLRTGDAAQAGQTVQHALAAGQAKRYPELYLYKTMARPDGASQQLDRLNAFLAVHQVPALLLRDPSLPPSPCNVQCAHVLPQVEGPLVSILMTTYRTGVRASVAIESLLNQTYRNIEIIVVDDASGDETPDLVAEWARKDARVRLLRLPTNGGTYLAKSMGLKFARGELVTCHDSDDWSHPVKIERQVQPLLENVSLIATTSHWVRMQDDGIFYARPVHPLMRLNPSSPLFRREQVLQRIGAWDMVCAGADSEFYARLRLVFGKRAIRRVAQPLALGSHREGSLMTASDTGYSDTGISPQRLHYWESWSHWHLACLHKGESPKLPLDLKQLSEQRKFTAPQEIVVTTEQVCNALAAMGATQLQVEA